MFEFLVVSNFVLEMVVTRVFIDNDVTASWYMCQHSGAMLCIDSNVPHFPVVG